MWSKRRRTKHRQRMSMLRKAVDFARFANRKLYPVEVKVGDPMQIHKDDTVWLRM